MDESSYTNNNVTCNNNNGKRRGSRLSLTSSSSRASCSTQPFSVVTDDYLMPRPSITTKKAKFEDKNVCSNLLRLIKKHLFTYRAKVMEFCDNDRILCDRFINYV